MVSVCLVVGVGVLLYVCTAVVVVVVQVIILRLPHLDLILTEMKQKKLLTKKLKKKYV